MKELWAKVLSGEVKSSGSTSLRTLDVLKNMSCEDARVFNNAAQYVIHDFIFHDHMGTAPICDPALSVSNLLRLDDCGLLHVDRDLMRVLDFSSGANLVFFCGDFMLRMSRTNDSVSEVQLPAALLTAAGRELLPVTERQLQIDYLRTLAKFLESRDCELSCTDGSVKTLVEQPVGGGKYMSRRTSSESNPNPTGNSGSNHRSS